VSNSLSSERGNAAADLKLLGTVMAVQANYYQVRVDGGSESQYLLCTRRSRLKKIGQKVMVGDRVVIEEPDFVDKQGAIAEVKSRSTELERPGVANADQILLVFALEEPTLDLWQLSKFLVKAESTTLNLCLCLNKTDLVTPFQQQQWQQSLEQWGYQPILISVANNKGINELISHLQNRITIIAGPSGVGKSSLINQLVPAVKVRVGEVSGKLNRGRHTTRHVELFELPGSGFIADTPGFNKPDLDFDPTELALYFPEAKKRLQEGNCHFGDCLHRDEPDCVVRGDWERYEHYLKFLEEAIARQESFNRRPDEESTLKLKIKSSGEHKYEPKLESKKYRRVSRRRKNQNIDELYEEAEDI
jgi:ribosome biogenesis GTPase / thiamine phosphate phosphatase